MGSSGCRRDLDPVSPMGTCGSGCRVSVTTGRAGLTLHRWFDAIAVCASCKALTAIRQKDVYERWSSCFKSGKFKVSLKMAQSERPRGWFIQRSLRCFVVWVLVSVRKWCRCTFCAYYPPAWANWLLILGYGLPEPEAGISRSTATHALFVFVNFNAISWSWTSMARINIMARKKIISKIAIVGVDESEASLLLSFLFNYDVD